MSASAIVLKRVLTDAGIQQSVLADACGLTRSAFNVWLNRGVLPVSVSRLDVENHVITFIRQRGDLRLIAPDVRAYESLFQMEPPRWRAAAPGSPEPVATNPEELRMLLRKQSLTPQARRHFGLAGDPFGEPTSSDEVFLSPDIRYVRESMYQVARHGGFMAVVGESGAGKTTLREELLERIRRDERSVIVIEPYVLAMEGNDQIGKTLRSQHIAEAIMACVQPLAKTKSSPEARFRQLHEALRDSSRAGHSHVLIIEEAHSLPLATLKHLKRFRELKDGLKPLLSVILLGQPELGTKLSEHNPEVREVVQRIEVITLPSLGTHVGDYLAHRFKRQGVTLDKVLGAGALDALRAKLTPTRNEGSLLYPLAVHNCLAAAMNRAADLGAPQVNADLVKGG